jgi:homoserine kinase
VPDRVTAYAPGSTSNLGPGFDCLGIAFTGKGDRVTAIRSSVPGVRVVSVSDSRIPLAGDRNTAALAAAFLLRMLPGAGADLIVDKGLPLAAGMGGSAASAVAGAVAVDALFGLGTTRQQLLKAGIEAEAALSGRHADNVAPSLLGGAVVVSSSGQATEVVSFTVHPGLALVLAIPDYRVETAQARAVLPREVSRADAVSQAAALAGLVLGLERGDLELIGRCLRDRIAEPYRAALYPGYLEARRAGIEAGATGVVVSGAGPTLVAIAGKGKEEPVARAVVEAYDRLGIVATTHAAEVDPVGARVLA